MGWEWRYFTKRELTLDGIKHLCGKREDIYFLGTPGVGLKLRNGNGSLEVKVRADIRAMGEQQGMAEKWVKSIYPGLTKNSDELDENACLEATGLAPETLFGPSGQSG